MVERETFRRIGIGENIGVVVALEGYGIDIVTSTMRFAKIYADNIKEKVPGADVRLIDRKDPSLVSFGTIVTGIIHEGRVLISYHYGGGSTTGGD